MKDLTHGELTGLPGPELQGLMDRGLVDRDIRGRLFVTLAGQCLRARSARDAMLMRLGIRQEAVTIRTGPDATFTISVSPDVPEYLRCHEVRTSREARELAMARQAARLAGEADLPVPPRHLRAV